MVGYLTISANPAATTEAMATNSSLCGADCDCYRSLVRTDRNSSVKEVMRLSWVFEAEVLHELRTITYLLRKLIKQEKEFDMAVDAEIQTLIDDVTDATTVEAGATTAIEGLIVQLTNAINAAPSLSADDKAALLATADQLTQATAPLAAAIATVPPAQAKR